MITRDPTWSQYFFEAVHREDADRSNVQETWISFCQQFQPVSEDQVLYLQLDVMSENQFANISRSDVALAPGERFSFFARTAPSSNKRFGCQMDQARRNLQLLRQEEHEGQKIHPEIEMWWNPQRPHIINPHITLNTLWEFITQHHRRARQMQIMASAPKPPELMVLLVDLMEPKDVWKNAALQTVVAYLRLFQVIQITIQVAIRDK